MTTLNLRNVPTEVACAFRTLAASRGWTYAQALTYLLNIEGRSER